MLRRATDVRSIQRAWQKVRRSGDVEPYQTWIRHHHPSRHALRSQRAWSITQSRLFTLVTVVDEADVPAVDQCLASLLDQSYSGWEWILVTTETIAERLKEASAGLKHERRARIVLVTTGTPMAHAWNAALSAGRGEHAAVLGPCDTLSPDALFEMATALEQRPDAEVVYSDEDLVTATGSRHSPRFKPAWSPELMLTGNYIGRLTMVKVATLRTGRRVPCRVR